MNYYDEIKEQITNNKITKRVKDYSKNRSDLNTYYNIDLSTKYDVSYLIKIRKFYHLIEKVATVSPKLSYSHYVELLPYDDINKITYYIKIVEENNLSIRELRSKIKNHEYERLPEETKNKLATKESSKIKDLIKNPIMIKNNANYEIISEKVLQKLILENISSFLKELGNGFTYIENEYKIKLDNNYNYIDLLLYNIKFKCYVVIELKITELKKEHIGQLQTYMNYIDKNIKTIEETKTIGIIIVKKNNKYIMEYCSDNRIIAREYELM